LLGIGISLGLAVLAQSALLRTHGAPLAFASFARPASGRSWKVCLTIALAANAGSLALFGRNTGLTLSWELFGLSVVLAGLTFWAMDGRPGVRLDWRSEAPWLAALAALIISGAALRLISLGSLPFGLWYDEAYSGLQVQRILTDPGYRPVYAQEPSLLWYLMAASVKALGASVFALRLPTAIGGILGIPAIYLLGRELFDRRVGLIAAGLLTTLVWHLTFSRVRFNSEWSVTLDALGLFFLIRALKKGSWTAAGLAGISVGLGLHMYYTSRLMLAVAGFALFALWLGKPRERFQTAWRVALAAIVAGLITGSPILEFAKMHPAEFNSRLQQASVFTEVRDQHSYQPVIDNVRAHLLMFNLAGDRNARHNLPGQPELNFLLGGLFVLGLGLCLARARRPEYALLPIWGLLMLAGGVFSVAFEAPQSLRTIDEINVVVLLCALPLALLLDAVNLESRVRGSRVE
jgi:4-amino-4-deoxy-L-arabinose transferase-like glycosyltransferase